MKEVPFVFFKQTPGAQDKSRRLVPNSLTKPQIYAIIQS